LDAGRLVYKRVKTRGRKHTPTINYKLWPETIVALREGRSSDPELWFLTEAGLPLKESKIVGTKESKWSALTRQWQRWQESGDVPNKPPKGLRKTSATLIESKFPGWEETFLGHAPTTIAGRHYVVKDGQPNPDFDRALDWLREQLLVSETSVLPEAATRTKGGGRRSTKAKV
jgi:integrase